MHRTRVDLTTADGVVDCYAFTPAPEERWPAVILYMDAFGIRPALDSMAQRLADAGFYVIVPNLYYRSGPIAPLDPKRVYGGDDAEHARFRTMIGSVDNTKVLRDTGAVLGYLAIEPRVDGTRVGAVGYCLGGGFAITALGRYPDRVVVAASVQGAGLATDKPDSPHRVAPTVAGRLYIAVAGIDPGFPAEQQERLEAALREARVDYTLETYAGVKHGFAVPDHVAFDAGAAERHWHVLLDLFAGTLGTPAA